MSFDVTFAAVVLSFLQSILLNVWQSLLLRLGFRPLFLLAEDVPS